MGGLDGCICTYVCAWTKTDRLNTELRTAQNPALGLLFNKDLRFFAISFDPRNAELRVLLVGERQNGAYGAAALPPISHATYGVLADFESAQGKERPFLQVVAVLPGFRRTES